MKMKMVPYRSNVVIATEFFYMFKISIIDSASSAESDSVQCDRARVQLRPASHRVESNLQYCLIIIHYYSARGGLKIVSDYAPKNIYQ